MQHRILTEGPLHRPDGTLQEAGYATSLMKTYDRGRIKAPRWRIKEWDYYLVQNETFALALTIADNGYMGLDSVSLLDYKKGEQFTDSRISLLPLGKRDLPGTSETGISRALGKDYEINFVVGGGKRELYGHFYNFKGSGKQLLFDLSLLDPRQDSMAIITPFEGKPRHFYYNQKINCLPAEGRVIFDNRDYLFPLATSFGTLDWGRGVWPYRNTWYWGSANGLVQGSPLGLNLGHGFGDTSRATENMILFEGKAHKLGRVHFAPPEAHGKKDYMKPWQVQDEAGRLRLVFTPMMNRAAKLDALVLASIQNQVFGHFSGSLVLDSGRAIDVSGLNGFLEEVSNKW